MLITLSNEEILEKFSLDPAICVFLFKNRNRDYSVRELYEELTPHMALATIKSRISYLKRRGLINESPVKRFCSKSSRITKTFYLRHLPVGLEMLVDAHLYN